MDIYVYRQAGSSGRLGYVPANQTVTFSLPPGLVAGAVSVWFEARPVRGSGQTVTSEQFAVHGGDELTWSIPAQ